MTCRYELNLRFSSEKITKMGTDGLFIYYIYIQSFQNKANLGKTLPKDVRQVATHNTNVHQNGYVTYFVVFTTKMIS